MPDLELKGPDGLGSHYGWWKGHTVHIREILDTGYWAIFIDGEKIGSTSSMELAKKIALSEIDEMEERR